MSESKKPIDLPCRRRQADRTAETRQRIIDATIQSLYRVGYSAVTFAMVAEAASVSRGIITYHFASKADLMVAVRDAVYVEERKQIEAVRRRIGTRAYLRELPRHVLAGMRREPAIAVNEILLAARAEPELSAKLHDEEQAIEARTLAAQQGYYRELGLDPPANLAVVSRVAVAAFRGLAIAELVQGQDADIDACIEYLMELLPETKLLHES